MRLKLNTILIPAALFIAASLPLSSQTAPAANKGGIPIMAGAGFSDFNLDYGLGRTMLGPSAYVVWNFYNAPRLLNGFGVVVEGHDINFDRPATLTKMTQQTAEAGGIYTWRHFRKVQPYAEVMGGIGSIDWPPFPGSTYSHDTFTVNSWVVGAQYDLYRPIWIRADWEYQFWHQTWGPHDLNPHGYTIGLAYDFSQIHIR